MIDPNLSRWIWASCSKFFDDRKGDLTIFFEGDDRDTAKLKDFIEFRMDGPRSRTISHNYTRHDVFINILVQSTMDSMDTHRFWRTVGLVQALFVPCIPVYKYGDGPDDDPSVMVGVLQIRNDGFNGEQLKVSAFGQVDPTVRVQQATIEANYRMNLSE